MPIIQSILCRREWPHQAETNKCNWRKKHPRLVPLASLFCILVHPCMLRFQPTWTFTSKRTLSWKGSLNCFQRNLFSHLFSKHCAVAVQLDTLCTTSWQLWCAKTMPHPIITNPPQRSCDRASPGLAVPIPHAFERKQLKNDTRPFCYTWSSTAHLRCSFPNIALR